MVKAVHRFSNQRALFSPLPLSGWVGGVGAVRWVFLHALQQQHNGVELLPGSVIGPQRDDKVVQPVACALGRHDDQLVLEPVGAGVLERDVGTSLWNRGYIR